MKRRTPLTLVRICWIHGVTVNPADVYNPIVKYLSGHDVDTSEEPKFWMLILSIHTWRFLSLSIQTRLHFLLIVTSRDANHNRNQPHVFQTPTKGSRSQLNPTTTTLFPVHTTTPPSRPSDGKPRKVFPGRQDFLNPQAERYQEECFKIQPLRSTHTTRREEVRSRLDPSRLTA